jgi:hypothetical protein
MKLFLYIVPAVMILMAHSCSKKDVELREGVMEIGVQQCAAGNIGGNDLILCVDSIPEDSRCPSDVVCVWAGRAIVKFSLRKDHQTYPFTLSTLNMPNSYKKDTTLLGYKIELMNVYPYPKTNSSTPYNKKTVEVKISK